MIFKLRKVLHKLRSKAVYSRDTFYTNKKQLKSSYRSQISRFTIQLHSNIYHVWWYGIPTGVYEYKDAIEQIRIFNNVCKQNNNALWLIISLCEGLPVTRWSCVCVWINPNKRIHQPFFRLLSIEQCVFNRTIQWINKKMKI